MKGVSQKKSKLHRFIALAMAVVMVLTLVAVDSKFNLFAEDDADKVQEIDITEFLCSNQEFGKKTGELAAGAKKIRFTFDKSKVADVEIDGKPVTADDVKYLVYTGDSAPDAKDLATKTDEDKTIALDKSVELTDENGKETKIAFYYGKKDNLSEYVLIGTTDVLYDDVKPEITEVSVSEKDGSIVKGEGYYLVNGDEPVTIKISAQDKANDGEITSGVAAVQCVKDGDEKNISDVSRDGGQYVLTVTDKAGAYKFRSVDSAGNVSDWSSEVVIKRAYDKPEIKGIVYDENTSDEREGFLISQSVMKITVDAATLTAGEGDGAVAVGQTLKYAISINSQEKYFGQADITGGSASFEVPLEWVQDEAQTEHTIAVSVSDEFGNSSLWQDIDGRIVFIDEKNPEVNIVNIVANGKTYGTLDDYEAADNKWAKSITFDVSAECAYSYLDSIAYSYSGKSGDKNAATASGEATALVEDIKSYKSETTTISAGPSEMAGLGDGVSTVSVLATNYAGTTTTRTIDAYIDNEAPIVKVSSSSKNDTTTGYTVGANESLTVDFSDSLSGVAGANAVLRVTRGSSVSEKSYTGIKNGDKILLEETGDYVLTVTVTDNAGNQTKLSTGTIVVDTAKLQSSFKITGTKDNGQTVDMSDQSKTYYTNSKTVTVEYTVTGYNLDASCVSAVLTRTPFGGAKEAVTIEDIKSEAVSENAGFNRVTFTYVLGEKATQGKYEFAITTHKKNLEESVSDSASFFYDRESPKVGNIKMVESAAAIGGVHYYKSVSDVMLEINANDNSGNNDSLRYEVIDSSDAVVSTGSLTMSSGAISGARIAINQMVKDGNGNTGNSILPNEVYTVNVYLTDNAGNRSDSGKLSAKFAVDTQKPTVSIEGSKDNRQTSYWNKSNVTISAKASDNFYVSKYVISGTCDGKKLFDGSGKTVVLNTPAANVTSSLNTFTKAGLYKITVTAYDEVGIASSEASTTFIIDKTAPVVKAGNVDDTTINVNTEVFFDVSDDYGIDSDKVTLNVYYRTYDESSWSEAVSVGFSSVDSKNISASYKLVARDGLATQYYFTIEGTDNSGNAITSKDDIFTKKNNVYRTKTFYVDKTNPEVSIDNDPEFIKDDSNYFNKAVTFAINVDEQFSRLTNVIEIDNEDGNVNITKGSKVLEEKFRIPNDNGTWTKKYTYRAEGEYNLTIQVTDGCDNDDDSAVTGTHFYIDMTKPVINIDSSVNGMVSGGTVRVPFTISDNMKGNRYTVHVVRKDTSGRIVYDKDIYKNSRWGQSGNGISKISDEKYIDFSEEGDYEVTITASDMAGNKADKKTTKFRIDKTAPVITISGMNDTQTTAVNATVSVAEDFTLDFEGRTLASGDMNVSVTRKTDGTAAANVAAFGTDSFSSGNPHTVSYNCTEDGEYTITASARDLAGNEAATQTKTFKIDSTAPVITVKAVDKDDKVITANDVVGSADSAAANYVDMSLSVEEAFFATDDVDIKVVKDGQDVSGSYFTNYSNSAEVSTGSQRFAEDGVYSVSISAKDQLGNEAESYSVVFTVDNVAPTVKATSALLGMMSKEVVDENGSLLLNADDFADILNKGYEALWNVTDTSIFDVDARLDGVSLIDFSDMTDGYHKIEITVTDQVGHVTTDEFEFVYDGTAPRIIITGVEDGDTVNEPFTMTIGLEDEADEITEIVINGNTIDPSNYQNNKYEMLVEEYDTYEIQVKAVDNAGNVASTYNEATDSYFTFKLSEKLSPVIIVIIIVVAVLLVGLLVFVIIAGKKRRKGSTAA